MLSQLQQMRNPKGSSEHCNSLSESECFVGVTSSPRRTLAHHFAAMWFDCIVCHILWRIAFLNQCGTRIMINRLYRAQRQLIMPNSVGDVPLMFQR